VVHLGSRLGLSRRFFIDGTRVDRCAGAFRIDFARSGLLGSTGSILTRRSHSLGIVGSYVGSLLMYLFFFWSGPRFVQPIVRSRLVSADKMLAIEHWVKSFGAPGVFLARLLPVFRHLISIPAGIFRMSFQRFSLATILGSALWCTVLSVWGAKILGTHSELLNSPETMMAGVKKEMLGFVLLILGVAVLYAFVSVYRQRHAKK